MDLTPLDRKEASKYGMQYWIVTGTEAKNAKGWTSNYRLGVAAETIEIAIQAARDKYPGGRVLSAQHQGPIEIMVKTP